MSITLVIPGDPPRSRNAADKLHWSERQRDRDAWKWLVHEAWARAGRPCLRGPVAVRFRLYFKRGARRDLDNCVGACKPILDGMVDCGLIRDDSARVVQSLEMAVAVDKANPRTVLVVEPLEVST